MQQWHGDGDILQTTAGIPFHDLDCLKQMLQSWSLADPGLERPASTKAQGPPGLCRCSQRVLGSCHAQPGPVHERGHIQRILQSHILRCASSCPPAAEAGPTSSSWLFRLSAHTHTHTHTHLTSVVNCAQPWQMNAHATIHHLQIASVRQSGAQIILQVT